MRVRRLGGCTVLVEGRPAKFTLTREEAMAFGHRRDPMRIHSRVDREAGERLVSPTAPAIAEAVFHVTGYRCRDLSITPEKIVAAKSASPDATASSLSGKDVLA